MSALRAIDHIEQDWSLYIQQQEQNLKDLQERLHKLQASLIGEYSSPEHRALVLQGIRDLILKTRRDIDDRKANVRAKAIGPCPDLGELFETCDTRDEAFAVHRAWYDAVADLPNPQREAMLMRERENLCCGDPGHDYSDHIVEYQGQAILDTQLPDGEKGTPITGPSWTEVDPERWSDEYKANKQLEI